MRRLRLRQGSAVVTGAMTFTGADELLGLLRRRQEELGLSNQALEEVTGLRAGDVNQALGPSREKSPTLHKLMLLFDALALSGTVHADPTKEARVRPLWRRAGTRAVQYVRPPPRVSRVAVKRAKTVVLSEAAQRAARARWDKTTPAERQAVHKFLLGFRARTKQTTKDRHSHPSE